MTLWVVLDGDVADVGRTYWVRRIVGNHQVWVFSLISAKVEHCTALLFQRKRLQPLCDKGFSVFVPISMIWKWPM